MPNFDVNSMDEDAVLKEVWSTDNIETKTELNPKQVEVSNKLMTMSRIFDNELLAMHLKNFMELQKSKNRKSMDEFVSVVRAKKEDRVKTGNPLGGLLG